MKLLSFLSSILIFLVIISGCNSKQGGKNGLSGDTLKAGEKPVYSENGKLQYLVEAQKPDVGYRVREYTSDGKLYMDAMYKNDHRNGKCTHYYKNGQPFSVSFYVNGAKDSVETKYDQRGRIMAMVPYKNDKVQPGLKEFDRDGSLIPVNNTLIISEVDHSALEGKYYIRVRLSNPQKNVKFYASPQSDPDSRELLKISGDAAILNVPISTGGFIMKKLVFEAQYKTTMGNTLRLQKYYDLVVDK